MTVRELSADLWLDAHAQLAESPVWDAARQRLLWVDIPAGELHACDTAGQDRLVACFDEPIGAVATRAGGGLLVPGTRGIYAVNETGDVDTLVSVDLPDGRFNDACCAPDGSFWVGTLTHERSAGAARLFRLDGDHTLQEVQRDLTLSNGIAFIDATTLYHVDTPTRRVDLVHVDGATWRTVRREPVIVIEAGRGNPDGIALDDQGGIWVALWGGGAVHRYTPNGNLDMVVAVPATNVTSCCFVGRQLVITTAREGRLHHELAAEPLAGGLFACEPGVGGPTTQSFAG